VTRILLAALLLAGCPTRDGQSVISATTPEAVLRADPRHQRMLSAVRERL